MLSDQIGFADYLFGLEKKSVCRVTGKTEW